MKKWISLFVAVLLTALAVVPAAADEAYQKGDANMDGHVTISDATQIQRYLAEMSACDSFWKLFTADADNDGVLSISDVTTLQRELAQFYTLMGNVPDGNATIAQAAVSMAYPNRGDGYLTPGKQLYRDVLQLVLPGDGIVRSCDRFVCASVRWSGADDNYPAGHVGTQADYLDAHPEKWQSVFGSTFMVSENYRHSVPAGLQPGDVVIEYSAYDFRSHTFIYCGEGLIALIYPDVVGEGYNAASASYDDTAPQCTYWSLTYNYFRVFRCKQYESRPLYKNVGLKG